MLFAPAPEDQQPTSFAFSPENEARIKEIIAKYPAGREQSAVMPLLDLAQRQCNGWLPRVAMEAIAERLNMPYIRVYEVATFYSMYNLAPVGKYFLQVCRTTPCWLRGSEDVTNTIKSHLGIDIGGSTADGNFTLVEVECLGACANAPMIQINDDYYEDLDAEKTVQLLEDLKAGKARPGSAIGRTASAPCGKLTSLTTVKDAPIGNVANVVPSKAAALKADNPKKANPTAAKSVTTAKARTTKVVKGELKAVKEKPLSKGKLTPDIRDDAKVIKTSTTSQSPTVKPAMPKTSAKPKAKTPTKPTKKES